MTGTQLVQQRLRSQRILDPSFKTAKEVVRYMGAMQAQDYAMSKWAVGLRMKSGTEKTVDTALAKGDILRTHILRPTWHLVAAENIYWMLALSKPRINGAMKSRHKQLGLSEAVVKKSNRIIANALAKGDHLTREALMAKLQAAKIATDENRASHLFFCAELEGIACSGADEGSKRTYALLESRVPKKKLLSKDESLARLASIYFKSRGPATVPDFTWWSGLSITEAKSAVAAIQNELEQETVDNATYYFTGKAPKSAAKNSLILLPAFDELLISYKNRSASIQSDHHKKAVSVNGIFWPTVLVNGRVAGLWKRSIHDKEVTIETELFGKQPAAFAASLKTSAAHFARFLGKKAVL